MAGGVAADQALPLALRQLSRKQRLLTMFINFQQRIPGGAFGRLSAISIARMFALRFADFTQMTSRVQRHGGGSHRNVRGMSVWGKNGLSDCRFGQEESTKMNWPVLKPDAQVLGDSAVAIL